MSDAVATLAPTRLRLNQAHLIWLVAIAASLLLYLERDLVPWASSYPDGAIIPIADWIAAFMTWLKRNFTWLTRGVADLLNVPLKASVALLAKPFKIGNGAEAWYLPRLSWAGVVIAGFLAGHAL
ncbi:MAG TPA: ABC transporter permease, partial [Aestuariivirgaceae bacterium]